MSYAVLEAKIREDTLSDVPRRIAELGACVGGRSGSSSHAQLHQEFSCLERLIAADSDDRRRRRNEADFACLRDPIGRLSSYPRVGTAARIDDSAPTSPTADGSSTDPRSIEAPERLAKKYQANTDLSVQHLASFLSPSAATHEGEDEVRLLAVERGLARELSRFPVLAVPETEDALVLRSWRQEDDEQSVCRDRLAILELSQAAANLREVQEMVFSQVLAAKDPLNVLELNTARASDEVAQTVVTLVDVSGRDSLRRPSFVTPSVAIAAAGAATVLHGPGILACFALRGLLVASAAGASHLGVKALSGKQKKVLAQMRGQMPRAFIPLPESVISMLRSAADEAERRLCSKLGDVGAWRTSLFQVSNAIMGLPARYRESSIRAGGSAWSTCFSVGMTAKRVFQVLQCLGLEGSLDPGCSIVWSRPVDAETHTYVRYLVFSKWFANRDFFCVCRSGQVTARASSSTRDGEGELYVFVVMSLPPDMLAHAGLPQPSPEIKHGGINVCGVAVRDHANGDGGALVEIMADVDPATPAPLLTSMVDAEVKRHVLFMAQRLRLELRKAEVRQP